MPLDKSCAKAAVGKNISTLVREKKPQKQAIAIALSIHRRACGQKPVREDSFADVYGVKKRWKTITQSDLKKHPELADELFHLVQLAYKPIGGHATITTPSSFVGGDVTVIKAIDVDSDPEADAVSLGKRKGPGVKSVGMGHDGSRAAKDAVLKHKAAQLKSHKQYAEMSGAIAHIMLTRYGIPSVNDHEAVEKVLGKKVKWIGEHPNGKYPENTGWYERTIGGKTFMKILLGVPFKAKRPPSKRKPVKEEGFGLAGPPKIFSPNRVVRAAGDGTPIHRKSRKTKRTQSFIGSEDFGMRYIPMESFFGEGVYRRGIDFLSHPQSPSHGVGLSPSASTTKKPTDRKRKKVRVDPTKRKT